MNRGLKITLVVLSVAAVGTIGFFSFRYFQKKKTAPLGPDATGKLPPAGGSSGGSGIVSQKSGGSYVPPASSSSASDFPLKNGSNNASVGILQAFLGKSNCSAKLKDSALGVPAVDNAFGPITEAALNACYGVKQVDQAFFNQIAAAG
jgi:hypothetical protein